MQFGAGCELTEARVELSFQLASSTGPAHEAKLPQGGWSCSTNHWASQFVLAESRNELVDPRGVALSAQALKLWEEHLLLATTGVRSVELWR